MAMGEKRLPLLFPWHCLFRQFPCFYQINIIITRDLGVLGRFFPALDFFANQPGIFNFQFVIMKKMPRSKFESRARREREV